MLARLGGPERAAKRLEAYLRLPRWMNADRVNAAHLLILGGEYAVPTLVEALRDEDTDVRSRAAFALGRIGSDAKEAVPALAKALEDTDAGVRMSAAEALGFINMNPDETIPALAGALGDENAHVRRFAVMALGFIGPEAREALPELKRLLKDADPEVRKLAFEVVNSLRFLPVQDEPDKSKTPEPGRE